MPKNISELVGPKDSVFTPVINKTPVCLNVYEPFFVEYSGFEACQLQKRVNSSNGEHNKSSFSVLCVRERVLT